MAIVDLYNMKGQKIGEQELSDEIFSIEPNLDVMWRYIDYQLSRRRAGTASTKTRAEVSGGEENLGRRSTRVGPGTDR